MADEATISVAVEFAKGDAAFNARDLDLLAQSLTVSGANFHRGTGTATTSAAALELGAVATPGLLILKNRGAVAIHLRSGSGGTNTVNWPAGLGLPVVVSGTTPYLITASSTAAYEYILIEA